MKKRTQNNRSAEVVALSVLHGFPDQWMRALEVSRHTALPWRCVAFALRRLSARGVVMEQIITYKGTARSKEETRIYRANTGTPKGQKLSMWFGLPGHTPVVPPAPLAGARKIKGRCSE